LGGHLAYLERRGLRGRAPARLVVSCLSAVFFGSTVLIPVARAAEPCAPAVAEVVSVEGAVEVQREGETRWQPAQLGDPLCLGDIVRTGRVSRAALVLANDSVLRLDRLTELRLRAVTDEGRSLLDMVAGAIQFFSRRPRALEIDTPFVTAAGEGTEFFVRVADDRTRIVVFEGRVRALNPAGELLLADGDAALAPEGQPPRAEIIVRPRDAVAWALYYPPVLTALAERTPRPRALPRGLEQAVARVAANDYPGALDALDAVPEAARDVRYWTYRAGVLANVGRVEVAQQAIERALALDPDAAGALAQRSVILIARQEEAQALADARRAVERAPESAPARIALSYAHQARAELKLAREVLREAVERAPDDALAWARLAEIELSSGNLDAAEDAAEQATALAPELGRTQMVRGFAELVRIDIEEAKTAFERAIALDSANPLARLGLGLARIRQSDLDEGRREIEIAAGLSPSDALVRSYLGKAYFEETREDKAGTQFEIAKRLDPKDPTPYFYDAIRKQLENRPVEALRDLQTSIRLNDNRAVYRSRLLLDQDLATRSVSLARIYDDLGFDQLALVEATRSLSEDPSNWSAHRFLSDTYARLPRHEIARASELLQSQLLQPININPVQPRLAVADLNVVEGTGPGEGAFNEFHPLFERNRAQLTATGVAGNGDGNEDTFGEEIVASGLWQEISLSLGQMHFQNNGFRPNNDVEVDLFDGFAQWAASPRVNLQAEYRHRDSEQGDLDLVFDPDAFDRDRRRDLIENVARLGLRVSPEPGLDVLGSLFYANRDEAFPAGGFPASEEGLQAETQIVWRSELLNLTTGAGRYDVDVDREDIRVFPPPRRVLVEFDREHTNTYAYVDVNLPRPMTWTIGFSFDSFEQEAIDVENVNPKFGVEWNITGDLRLRGAVFETVKRALVVEQTIEPTQIAGFNQFFDDFNGAEALRYGGAIDARITDDIFVGIEATRRELDSPLTIRTLGGGLRAEVEEQAEALYRGYVYWTPARRWALTGEFVVDRFEADSLDVDLPQEVDTIKVPLSARYFHPSGLFATLGATVAHQRVERGELATQGSGDDDFVLVDTSVGYRLPDRLGILSFEVRNLLGEEFQYEDNNFRQSETRRPELIPDRLWLARATLSF